MRSRGLVCCPWMNGWVGEWRSEWEVIFTSTYTHREIHYHLKQAIDTGSLLETQTWSVMKHLLKPAGSSPFLPPVFPSCANGRAWLTPPLTSHWRTRESRSSDHRKGRSSTNFAFSRFPVIFFDSLMIIWMLSMHSNLQGLMFCLLGYTMNQLRSLTGCLVSGSSQGLIHSWKLEKGQLHVFLNEEWKGWPRKLLTQQQYPEK